jgi:hypothetical protein
LYVVLESNERGTGVEHVRRPTGQADVVWRVREVLGLQREPLVYR